MTKELSDEKIDELIEQKLRGIIEEQNVGDEDEEKEDILRVTEDKMGNKDSKTKSFVGEVKNSVSRRRFLKLFGLGAIGTAFMSSTAARWSIFQPANEGISDINAEAVDGHSITVGSSKPSSPATGTLFYDTDGEGVHYYNGSSWVQVSANGSPAQKVTVDANIPSGASAQVTVYEDKDGDGTAENTETVSLSDGKNTYSLSNMTGDGQQYNVKTVVDNSDVTQTASIYSILLKGVGEWNSASEWNNAQSESGVVHENVANTDNKDASTVKQGYSKSSPSLTNSLELYIPLQEDSGSTAYDFSGNNRDGTTKNTPSRGVSSILGTTCYSFNESNNEWVDVPYGGVSGSGNRALSFWYRSSSSNAGNTFGYGVNSQHDKWEIHVHDSRVMIGTYYAKIYTDNTSNLHDGNWHHVVCTFNGTTIGDHKIYIDSSQKSTITDGLEAGLGLDTSTGNMGIATFPDEHDYYPGDIAEVKFWSRNLTSSEVQTLYDVVATQGTLTTRFKSV